MLVRSFSAGGAGLHPPSGGAGRHRKL